MATTILDDEKEVRESSGEAGDEATIILWKKRFKEAEDFRQPIDARNLRMYRLYRAYRGWGKNYAYHTNLMPPIGFEIIETVKPRLGAARLNVRTLPRSAADMESDSIEKWDNLIHYNLDVVDFDDLKIDWIHTALLFGNGLIQASWDGTDPYVELCDNWLTYIDPQAGKRLKGARWIIKRSWKEKELIEKEEKERKDEAIYDKDKLADLENQSVTDDPRRDRQRLLTLKMGQIDDATQRDDSTEGSRGSDRVDHIQYKAIELWECYDFVKQEIVTIGNREVVLRKDPNDYAKINEKRNPGNLFIDLPCISNPWEYYAIPLLEPVETTICEIADSRNQAMDNIVYNLDPVRKVRRGRGYKKDDLKTAPGAIWFMERTDDVVIERPPDISASWIQKDEILRKEIQTSLALSEYTQGIPRSAQEPMGKVELLLMQTNIRFAGLVRQFENAMTDLVNILVELNQNFLTEKKTFRLIGDDVEFHEFTDDDRNVYIDAVVDIIPKKEKSPEQESRDILELYQMLVVNDKPEDGDPQKMYQWEKKKTELQKLILERLGLEEYEEVLIPKPTMPAITPPQQPQGQMVGAGGMPGAIPMPPGGMAEPTIPAMQQAIPEKEPILPPEQMSTPGATTGLTQPREGLIKRLMQRIAGQ